MFTREFWKQTAERAIKTFAQALAAVLTVDVLMDGDQLVPAVVAALLAAGLSILTSLGSGAVGDPGPSLVTAPPVADEIDDGSEDVPDDLTAEDTEGH